MHLPRIMLAAPASGSGKTMITCGLLQTFVNRGLAPASFKCGPDYIDPMFHTKVIGAKSRNLDTFFTEDEVTRHLFARTAAKAGISVLEGVMGIFDGLGGTSPRASSYDLASVTDTPVILVVNARGMSLSVIPMIQGYLEYQKQLGKQVIRGVILNQMTKMTYLMLKEKIEQQTGTRLLGYVPRLEGCTIESRHLGLVTPDEITDLKQTLHRLSAELESCLDLEGILEIAEGAPDYEDRELQAPEKIKQYLPEALGSSTGSDPAAEKIRPRIGVAMDEAFCFYYQDNLELLKQMGAELVIFSPLHDAALPKLLDGMILGGGYPELYAQKLEENCSMKRQIYEALTGGMPYLAECGGFMYLHEEMEDMESHSHDMCGVIPGKSFRTPKLSRFGYIELKVKEDAGEQLLLAGQTIHGHEFHYFDSTNAGEDYLAQKPAGKRSWDCIHGNVRSAAGYPHLYYWSNPEFAAAFLKRASEYAKARRQFSVLG
ncbi:MAG: cobyrinate a,c-diamide synthase [Lachnospiraceae bacterium]|nr:cobyrinate a,c-diamide synthase [Lachnospiraceae bacterium]